MEERMNNNEKDSKSKSSREKKSSHSSENLSVNKKSMRSSLEKPAAEQDNKKNNLLAVIRISGMVKVNKDIENTLDRLRLRRKYACVLVNGNEKSIKGLLKKVRFYVAYGLIDKETLVELVKERGQLIDKSEKIDTDKVVNGLIGGEKLSDLGLKPFFRLHPPRKGIKAKLHYPKGVLGDHKDKIKDLIERML